MYNHLKIKKTDRILIVAPHPDDETVGCGGLLARFGPLCDVLLLTDGRKGVPADGSRTEEQTAAIRREEFGAAMAFFGVRSSRFLELPDSRLAEYANAAAGIELTPYDKIFVPYRRERHPDHASAYRIIKKHCKRQCAKAELLEYEVWSPIEAPNRFLDVSDVMEQKLAGIRLYASQIRELNYETLAAGLNSYRGAPRHAAYCEAYYSEAAARKAARQARFDRLPRWLRSVVSHLLGCG